MLSLYLHFPFCKRKCSYCDFCSGVGDRAAMEGYLRALRAEIALQASVYGAMPVDTVYLGGGTPSVMPAEAMLETLAVLRNRFMILPDAEWSSEANPGTLTDDWLDVLTEAGMNRLSLGVQAVQPQLLQTLGRIHTYPQALEAMRMARRHGMTNLNADAMFGLPGQTAADYAETLTAFAEAGVRHISAYALTLEEGTPLWQSVQSGALTLPDEDATADMLEAGVERLRRLGYPRYEISNFAQPGFLCRHNMGYWRQKPYLGLGISAASLLPPPDGQPGIRYVRRVNTTSVANYCEALDAGRLPDADATPIGAAEAMFETVMLRLRTVEGVSYADFLRMHGVALESVYGEAIATLRRERLLQPTDPQNPHLALTAHGLAVQNAALMPFMRDRDTDA